MYEQLNKIKFVASCNINHPLEGWSEFKIYESRVITGADPEGVHPARAPPKIGKKYDFLA